MDMVELLIFFSKKNNQIFFSKKILPWFQKSL